MADTAKSILLVDDEEDIITYLGTLLSDAGYDVRIARDGEEAMTEVRKQKPDLVSLDITMPQKSGVRFYREMREDPELKDVPIVIVTGIQNPWSSKAAGGTFEDFITKRKQVPPPDGFFEKPVDREKYLAKVAEVMGG
jgi:CheY-like chemotaxis protein